MEPSFQDLLRAGERDLDERLAHPKGWRRPTPPSAVSMDNAEQIGIAARQYRAEQFKAGNEISATDAVAHVMAQQRR